VCEAPKKPEKTAQLGGSSLSDCEAGWKDQTLEPATEGRMNVSPGVPELD
jgi:hypothetical protein